MWEDDDEPVDEMGSPVFRKPACSAVETEWSTASSSAGDSLTIFAKWGH